MLWGLQRRFAGARPTIPSDRVERYVHSYRDLTNALGDAQRGTVSSILIASPISVKDTLTLDTLNRNVTIRCIGDGKLTCADALPVMFYVGSVNVTDADINNNTTGRVEFRDMIIGSYDAMPVTAIKGITNSYLSTSIDGGVIFSSTAFIAPFTWVSSRVSGVRLMSESTSSPASISAASISNNCVVSENISNAMNIDLNSGFMCAVIGNIMRTNSTFTGGNIDVGTASTQYNTIVGNVLTNTITSGSNDAVGNNS